MEYSIKHTATDNRGRFYMEDENGMVSELTYQRKDGTMIVDHTQTRTNLQGNGLASNVLDHVVKYARENHIKIKPVCPFVVQKFKEIESYQDVRA